MLKNQQDDKGSRQPHVGFPGQKLGMHTWDAHLGCTLGINNVAHLLMLAHAFVYGHKGTYGHNGFGPTALMSLPTSTGHDELRAMAGEILIV